MIEFLEENNVLVDRKALLAALENTTLHVEINYFPWDKKGALRFSAEEIVELNVSSDTMGDGLFKLFDKLFDYSEEYQRNFAVWCVDQRRRHHLPYILRALAIDRPEKLYPMVDVVNKAEIEAVLNSEERNNSGYWQRISSEKDDLAAAIALEIICKKKIDLRTATEEVHAQLEEDIKREFERQMAERRGYAWARQEESVGKA